MTVISEVEAEAEKAVEVVREGGAKRRETLTKIASYALLVLFATFYVGPLLVLIFASMKSLP